MTAATAGRMNPAQAAELVRVLDLQARWENLRTDHGRGAAADTHVALRERQQAFDAYRAGQLAYIGRYKTDPLPDVPRHAPDRVAAWCRIVSAVLRRAEPEAGVGYPAHVVARAFGLAGRIAERMNTDPPGWATSADTVTAAVDMLDAVARWCDGLSAAPPPAVGAEPPADAA